MGSRRKSDLFLIYAIRVTRGNVQQHRNARITLADVGSAIDMTGRVAQRDTAAIKSGEYATMYPFSVLLAERKNNQTSPNCALAPIKL